MHLLIEVIAQTRDTITVLQTVSTGFQKVLGVAQIGAVLLAYLLLGAAIFAAIKINKALAAARDALEKASSEVRELAADVKKISRTVSVVTEAAQTEVASIQQTVEYANRRARRAIRDLADRVDTFNGAVGVVQEDTHNMVFSALAAIRGLGAGLGAMRKGRRPTRPRVREREEVDVEVTAYEDAGRPRLRRRRRALATQ
jgi:hypothetical protein